MVSFAVAISIFETKSNIGCSLFLGDSSGAAALDELARRRWCRTSTVGTLTGLEGGRRFQLVRFLFLFFFSIRISHSCSPSVATVLVITAASVTDGRQYCATG